MRFLPWLVMGAAVTLAVSLEGCDDRACLEWKMSVQGNCPSRTDAPKYFGTCSDVEKVLTEPTFIDDDGGLCCYDVTHNTSHFIRCASSDTGDTPTMITTDSPPESGTGGGSFAVSSSAASGGNGGTSGTGGTHGD